MIRCKGILANFDDQAATGGKHFGTVARLGVSSFGGGESFGLADSVDKQNRRRLLLRSSGASFPPPAFQMPCRGRIEEEEKEEEKFQYLRKRSEWQCSSSSSSSIYATLRLWYILREGVEEKEKGKEKKEKDHKRMNGFFPLSFRPAYE